MVPMGKQLQVSQATLQFYTTLCILVHSAQNGNGFGHPVRPYRSKDHLISSEPSTLHRPNGALKSIYSADDELIFNRRSTLKETDLDRMLHSPLQRSNGTANSSMKTSFT